MIIGEKEVRVSVLAYDFQVDSEWTISDELPQVCYTASLISIRKENDTHTVISLSQSFTLFKFLLFFVICLIPKEIMLFEEVLHW